MTRTLGKYGPPAPQITIIRTFLFIHTLFIYRISISKSIQTGASVSRASACCCSLLSAIHPNFLKPESRNKTRHARSAFKSLKGTIICLISTIFNHRLQIYANCHLLDGYLIPGPEDWRGWRWWTEGLWIKQKYCAASETKYLLVYCYSDEKSWTILMNWS